MQARGFITRQTKARHNRQHTADKRAIVQRRRAGLMHTERGRIAVEIGGPAWRSPLWEKADKREKVNRNTCHSRCLGRSRVECCQLKSQDGPNL
ncbi:hypothetical protein GN956_G22142 [Arapaima gigas]